MSSLLLGAVLDGAFSLLNQSLRDKTVEFARRKFNHVITRYSPWLCYAPVVDSLPPLLIYPPERQRGRLILDEAELAVMADFMAGPGREALSNLPGDYRTWLPKGEGISDVYDDAVAIIRSASPFLEALFEEIVEAVIPLGGGRNRGYSTHLARGAIFRSLPADNDAYDVAVDIVHEIGHQVLMVWQSVDPILASDPKAPVFSQIRRVDRPAIQTYHATVALAYMRALELALPADPLMQAAAARRGLSYSESLVHSLRLSIMSIREKCELTELGGKLLDEMEAVA